MKYEGCGFSRLGEKLKAARKEQKLTQSALADGLVTRNMLSRIENGCAYPSLPTLCELASRLGRPIGYFLDDRDDGTEEQDQRLLALAKSEYQAGNYASCLQYAECLSNPDEEGASLLAHTRFLLAVAGLYEGKIKETQSLFVEALKKEEYLTAAMRAQGKEYRALLDAFAYTPEAGKEEEILQSVLRYAVMSTDLSLFAGVLSVLRTAGICAAEAMLSVCRFTEGYYPSLMRGIIAMECGGFAEGRKHILEATGYRLPFFFRAYTLTLLEKCAAELKDFEGAYAYMTARKELISHLTEK